MNRWDIADLVVDSTLTPIERLVMLVLIKRADTNTAEIPEQFSPSLTRLASETGLARSTLTKTLNQLEQSGWVARHRPPKRLQLEDHARTFYVLLPGRQASPGDGLEVGRDTDQPSPGVEPDWSGNRTELGRETDSISPLHSLFTSNSPHIAAREKTREPTPSEIRAVRCTACRARSGNPCVDNNGETLSNKVHSGRYDDAKRAIEFF